MGVAQAELSRSHDLIQSCNRHAIRANFNKPRKQAKRRECQPRQRLVQKDAGRKDLLAGYLIPLLRYKKPCNKETQFPTVRG